MARGVAPWVSDTPDRSRCPHRWVVQRRRPVADPHRPLAAGLPTDLLHPHRRAVAGRGVPGCAAVRRSRRRAESRHDRGAARPGRRTSVAGAPHRPARTPGPRHDRTADPSQHDRRPGPDPAQPEYPPDRAGRPRRGRGRAGPGARTAGRHRPAATLHPRPAARRTAVAPAVAAAPGTADPDPG